MVQDKIYICALLKNPIFIQQSNFTLQNIFDFCYFFPLVEYQDLFLAKVLGTVRVNYKKYGTKVS